MCEHEHIYCPPSQVICVIILPIPSRTCPLDFFLNLVHLSMFLAGNELSVIPHEDVLVAEGPARKDLARSRKLNDSGPAIAHELALA